jgi:hypothetical protein
MAAFVNVRWPTAIRPTSCTFGKSRNDVAQESPRTRKRTFIQRGRPLYYADLTWRYPQTSKLAHLRYYLDKLEGFAGSVQIWNFASPYPYGIDYGYGAPANYNRRTLWTNSGSQTPFTWTGLPSHWVSGATVQMNAGAALAATSIQLKGLAASKPAVVTGQYVQVGRRLYIAAADANSNGSGIATVQLTSGLLAAAATNDIVRLVEAACEMELIDQDISEAADASDGMVSVRARFRETVEDVS